MNHPIRGKLTTLTWLTALTLSSSFLTLPGIAQAADAVSELGRLNGIALACDQQALTVRIREQVINFAPKERAIGARFEQVTNDTFLAHGKEGTACPDTKTLAGQIEQAVQQLKQQYPQP